jgi:hypothetical protein
MAKQAIDEPNCYAKCLGGRAWIAFKTKGCPWRGLGLDFQRGTRTLAPPNAVRSKTTGKKWVDDSAVRKARGSGPVDPSAIG